jgi:hypothetical protein
VCTKASLNDFRGTVPDIGGIAQQWRRGMRHTRALDFLPWPLRAWLCLFHIEQ